LIDLKGKSLWLQLNLFDLKGKSIGLQLNLINLQLNLIRLQIRHQPSHPPPIQRDIPANAGNFSLRMAKDWFGKHFNPLLKDSLLTLHKLAQQPV
jgi:hypothetical protein